MAEVDQLQGDTRRGGDHFPLQAIACQAAFHQFLGQQQLAVAHVHQRIGEFRVHVERLIGRDGPGGGGPDDDGGGLGQRVEAEGGRQLVGIGDREGHVDGVGTLVLVLHLGLGQGRAAVEAEVDRLEALEDEALLDQLAQGADLASLVGEVHGQVGIAPVTQHAQADEAGLLLFDLLARIGAATLAGQVRRLILAKGGLHLVLDGQAMAVPARHIGGVVAGQGLGPGDDVLEDLVQRMTDVNAAVGIGRTVMQDEGRPALADGAQLPVQVDVLPALERFRLALRQAGFHRECRFRQVERRFVIGHVSPGSLTVAPASRRGPWRRPLRSPP